MKYKNTFYNWLTNRFILIIRNEENFAVKKTFSFNYAKLLVLISGIVIFIFTVSFYLITTLLSMWFNPEHAQLQTRKKIVALYSKVDSLAMEVDRKDMYIREFKAILSGDVVNDNEENVKKDNLAPIRTVNTDQVSPADSLLRNKFEKDGIGLIPFTGSDFAAGAANIKFVKPADGVIVEKFSSEKLGKGVRLRIKSDQSVKAIAAGKIIYSGPELTGYHVILVQHDEDLLSIYRVKGSPAKDRGDSVEAGDILFLSAGKEDFTSFMLEIWLNGMPVDPEFFVSF